MLRAQLLACPKLSHNPVPYDPAAFLSYPPPTATLSVINIPLCATAVHVNAEVARRTFWVLESQDHLYSEHNAAVAFPPRELVPYITFNHVELPPEPWATMWKDESLTSPNKAARDLFDPNAELSTSMENLKKQDDPPPDHITIADIFKAAGSSILEATRPKRRSQSKEVCVCDVKTSGGR
ncbi:uncharacterized protein LY89DRAFT_738224 [Mollisia scopiformis]|uniref:Uncharacterized protein n=1 Tax=Mollisia scopiformis TaxID=149040 RepID=A0A194WXM9_MOLSC|nr:uncharacterized protein LY89DRAFT_738224 [Mollisia scopiformis]KUJ12434.1 hypothetical protein LY89DRAFT_738224 [Mollisia scopiformis]